MKSVHLYRFVTVAAVTLAAIQMSDASSVGPAPLTKVRAWTSPCAPDFLPSPPTLGRKYGCSQRFVVRCKQGYFPGEPKLVQRGRHWVVRYRCARAH